MNDPIPVTIISSTPWFLTWAPSIVGGLALLGTLGVAWWNHKRAVERDAESFVRAQLTEGVREIVGYIEQELFKAAQDDATHKVTKRQVLDVGLTLLTHTTTLGMYSASCGKLGSDLLHLLWKAVETQEGDEDIERFHGLEGYEAFGRYMQTLALYRLYIIEAYHAAIRDPKADRPTSFDALIGDTPDPPLPWEERPPQGEPNGR
ncbi:hypothetical protein [Tsukamurella sp. PLM1]|uniref:hypothetical protein n=1 Tax=Tsukamurella sp. PLM1 TaxID=2929795 RepID=UPI0020483B32|nr:hypothetical protein [Tsukamurella sp. PLM1]BDH55081.1 hypothetical protein MTP03_00200 [Tsukamurella sp. PLM1]